MGDSDDEYERRRRDKFRGERSDYTSSSTRDRRDDSRRGREDWSERNRENWGSRDRGSSRREYSRDYGRSRDRYSPSRHDMSPPVKRMRQDWDDRRYAPYDNTGGGGGGNYGAYGGAYGQDYGHPAAHGGAAGRLDDLGPTQPPMMTFKAFMEQCDDSISEEEALRKYSDYKLEFKRQQLNEFFVNHKEEEWFKARYHPEECVKRREEQLSNLKWRVSTFVELYSANRMEPITVDADQSDQLLKLLDSVVIKLEGGTDLDLQVLDQVPEEDVKPQITEEDKKPFILGEDSEPKISDEGEDKEKDQEKNPEEPLKMDMSDEQVALQKKAKEYLKQKEPDGEKETRKRKHSSSSSSSSSSDSEDEQMDEDGKEPPPPGMEKEAEPEVNHNEKEEEEEEEEKEADEETETDSKTEEESTQPKENGLEPPGEEEENNTTKNGGGGGGDKETESQKNGETTKETTNKEPEKNGDEEGSKEEDEEPKPRALHKTASIFLRNLAPTITKQEVEAMCRRYNGFLRAAIADPQPERRWFRRGWVTFKRHVNIKDICWNLNNIRLRDCELGAIVNRDLSRRIRTVNGITSHKSVVRADIKLAAKIIQNLDSRWSLWLEGEITEEQLLSLTSSLNPVLRNITDYLIEEASAEEEELLGANNASTNNSEEKAEGEAIERDPTLIRVLDRLLLYLRIVHSVDYYNHSEYPNEDEMPNRCGIMHARGIPPSSKVTPQEVNDYVRAFENKIGSFLQPLTKLSDDESKKLGLKEAEEEVEKFVQSNTQEVAKDKWQCPLCGKKFKGAEYVHKHILIKHAEKVKEVKKEVDYFNNYLRDPKRPQLPEYPGNKHGGAGRKDDRPDPYVATYPQAAPGYGGYGGGGYGRQYPAAHGYAYGSNYPKDYYGGRPDPYNREPYQRPRVTYRSRVGYRDLDAPKEDY